MEALLSTLNWVRLYNCLEIKEQTFENFLLTKKFVMKTRLSYMVVKIRTRLFYSFVNLRNTLFSLSRKFITSISVNPTEQATVK